MRPTAMQLIHRRRLPLACLAAAALLAGCGSKDEDTSALAPPRPAAQVAEAQYDYEDAEVIGGRLSVPDEDGDARTLAGVFYFDYDEAIVRREGHAELRHHARALAENSRFRLRLEGHADERGTREYNLALGERRANAVSAFLRDQGASAAQLDVISFGEEKPVDRRHTEAAWARNRRVQLVYD